MDIAWVEDQQEFEQSPNAKIAVQYAVAYQYEHREEADHHILCGAVTDRCRSTVRYLVCRASSDMAIRRTGFM